MVLPGGDRVDYVVDARNRRVGRKKNGTYTSKYLYLDQLNPVAELDENNNLISLFVYGSKSHVPDYMIKSGVKYRIISDQLGSVRSVINTNNGTTAQEISYNEWGMVLSDSNPGLQPFGYAGGIYDSDTKLVRFGARDYDASVGRWTAKDPILFAGGDTNLYRYVQNSPLNFIDPSGRIPVIIVVPIGTAILNAAISGYSGYKTASPGCEGRGFATGVLFGAVTGFFGGVGYGTGSVVSAVIGGGVGSVVTGVSGVASAVAPKCDPPPPPNPSCEKNK